MTEYREKRRFCNPSEDSLRNKTGDDAEMKVTSGYNLLLEYDEIVKLGIIERHGRTGRGTVYVLKGSNDS